MWKSLPHPMCLAINLIMFQNNPVDPRSPSPSCWRMLAKLLPSWMVPPHHLRGLANIMQAAASLEDFQLLLPRWTKLDHSGETCQKYSKLVPTCSDRKENLPYFASFEEGTHLHQPLVAIYSGLFSTNGSIYPLMVIFSTAISPRHTILGSGILGSWDDVHEGWLQGSTSHLNLPKSQPISRIFGMVSLGLKKIVPTCPRISFERLPLTYAFLESEWSWWRSTRSNASGQRTKKPSMLGCLISSALGNEALTWSTIGI